MSTIVPNKSNFIKPRSQRAFTLVEILVCVAIIAVLAALMFPVFSRAKNSAKETSAASNLKQIYTALKLYQVDYPESVPYGTTPQMGFPHFVDYIEPDGKGFPGAPRDLFYSPCGYHPSFTVPGHPAPGGAIMAQFSVSLEESITLKAILEHKDDAIILLDGNCMSHDIDAFASDDSVKKYLLVSLGGQLRTVNTKVPVTQLLALGINNIEE